MPTAASHYLYKSSGRLIVLRLRMMIVNKYAQVALLVAQYIKTGSSPVNAWEKESCEVFMPGSSSQKKGCLRLFG